MKATISLEAIGDNGFQLMREICLLFGDPLPKSRYWVAEIIYKTGGHYCRKILRGKKDYSHANSVGSRGVKVWYILESGRVYEVEEPVSWKRNEHYICTVAEDGTITRIRVKLEDVEQWINDHLA